MKIKVRVAYSVTHVTTVTVTVASDGITVARSAKTSSTKVSETVLELRAAAIEQVDVVRRALA